VVILSKRQENTTTFKDEFIVMSMIVSILTILLLLASGLLLGCNYDPTITPAITQHTIQPTTSQERMSQIPLEETEHTEATAIVATSPSTIVPQYSSPTPVFTEPQENPDIITAKVTKIVGGNTIEVNINGKTYTIRYIGVDTPEMVAPNQPVKPYGPEASAKNKELVSGKEVRLEKDVSETDGYGSLLRYVYVGDLFVNAEMVRQGYAQAVTYPPDVKYQDLFLQLQREARAAGRGLWAQAPKTSPTPTEDIVYITNSGTKYHRDGCSSLSKSKIPISRADAIAKGYTACSVCNP
jgi:micrococcal nuclease